MSLRMPLVVGLLMLPTVAHANHGVLTPPLELEVGRSAITTADGRHVGATELLVGMSAASAYPREIPVDVSMGWVGSFRPYRPFANAEARATDANTSDHGAFLAIEARAAGGDSWRAWIGGRAELFPFSDGADLGAFGRVSIELWTPISSVGGRSAVIGTFALSAWAEVGFRGHTEIEGGRVASGGIGVRLPFAIAN